MKKLQWERYIIPLILLIISTFFFFYNLDTLPLGLYQDEAINGLDAQLHPLSLIYPENGGREGFYIVLQSLFLFLSGVSEVWVLRACSALGGIVGMMGFYFLSKNLFSYVEREHSYLWSGIGSFFLLTTFSYTVLSRVGFRAIYAVVFLVWTLFFIEKAIDKKSFLWISGAGVVGAIGMYTYSASYISPLIYILFFILIRGLQKEKIKYFFKKILYFFIFFILTSLPLFFSLSSIQRFSELSIFSKENSVAQGISNSVDMVGMLFFSGDMNVRHNIPSLPFLSFLGAVFFIFATVHYIRILFKKEERNALFSFLSFSYSSLFVGMVPAIFSSEGIPHAMRAILIIPFTSLISMVGVYTLYHLLKEKLSSSSLVKGGIGLVFLMLLFHGWLVFFVWGNSVEMEKMFSKDAYDLALQIRSLDSSLPVVVVLQEETDRFYRNIPFPATSIAFLNPKRDIHFVFEEDEFSAKAVFYLGEKEITRDEQQ